MYVLAPGYRADEGEAGHGADELGRDERKDGGGCDPREGVGEHAADRDGRVGERRRAGEPVGGTEVGADRRGRQAGPSSAGQREDHGDETGRGHEFGEDVSRRGAAGGGDVDGGTVEHDVGKNGPRDGAGDLNQYVPP